MAHPDHSDNVIPVQPIDRVVRPLERFLHVESASGIVLLVSAAAALVIANSPASKAFLEFWKTEVGFSIGSFSMLHSLKHWINDGLMAVFFFVIGLEVKHELVHGELRAFRRAALPLAAALGGMIVPAGIFLALQYSGPARDGWGIPMATDIAFVVGCMALLGNRVPRGFRAFVLSLAIADDIGAILVIAFGYTAGIEWHWLLWGLAGLGAVAFLSRVGVRSLLVYGAMGVAIWIAFHESGVHATIAGVALGLLTPAHPLVSDSGLAAALRRVSDLMHGKYTGSVAKAAKVAEVRNVSREAVSPVEYLENRLHPWVAFVIMPVFALANAGVPFAAGDLLEPVALAVMAGLVLGKPIGVFVFSWLAVRAGIAQLPERVTWRVVFGGGVLAGIGFTMALFIASLALEGDVLNVAKVGVLSASVLAAVVGSGLLAWWLPKAEPSERPA